MNFASLLPGVRQLRAPVIAGVLSLLTVFLWLEKPIADLWEDPDLSGLQNIEGFIGKAGALAALAFVAYLVGSLVVDVAMSVVRAVSSVVVRRNKVDVADSYLFGIIVTRANSRKAGRLRRIAQGFELRILPMWRDGYAGLGRRITRIVSEGGESCLPNSFGKQLQTAQQHQGYEIRNEDEVRRDALEQFKDDVVQEIASGTVAARLLVSDSYGRLREEYDRHSAEAELRLGIALPFLALLITVAVELRPAPGLIVCFAGFLLLMAIVWHGLTSLRQAGDILGLAIGDLGLSTPMIDLAQRQVELKGPQLSPAELDRARVRSENAAVQLLPICSNGVRSLVSPDGLFFVGEVRGLTDEIEKLAVQLLNAEVRERFHQMVFVIRNASALAEAGEEFPRVVASTVEDLARNAVSHVLSGEELQNARVLSNWRLIIEAHYEDMDRAAREHRDEERRSRTQD